jgi:hypothetical protein
MHKVCDISIFMLERYKLKEMTAEEKTMIETALSADPELAETLVQLNQSDMELRQKYAAGMMVPRIQMRSRQSGQAPLVWGLCAAALFLVIALPFLFFFKDRIAAPKPDRLKGSTSLRVYLKTDTPEGSLPLADHAVLHEGNTIQLAYMINEERYGVIFSIDGRSVVTVHYPYSPGQSTRLIPGKQIALDDAYTLDDAPNYELFFFVTSNQPLNVEEVLRSAQELARNPASALEQSRVLFKNYEITTITMEKE